MIIIIIFRFDVMAAGGTGQANAMKLRRTIARRLRSDENDNNVIEEV